jgi:hypothetical protein
MGCPQMVIELYKGLMKAYTSHSNILEGSTAVLEHEDKDQTDGLEIAESCILCRHQA